MIRKILITVALTISFIIPAHALTAYSLLHHRNDPVAGNPAAPVTVLEFFDYQCSHCTKMAPVMGSLMATNKNVRIIFKELPIKGAASELASRAALAANKQGKYYSFSHALLTTNQSLTRTNILGIAKSLGLNMRQLEKDMESPSVYREIAYNYDLAKQLGVRGTPAFIITKTNEKDINNIHVILGEMSLSELQEAVNQLVS